MEPSVPPEQRRGVRLGVDVGRARVGLAASDPSGVLAMPVDTLRRDVKKGFDRRIIAREASRREAVVVYVGHPVNLQGKPTASTDDAVEYAQALAALLADERGAAEVRLVDERLSTVSAHRQLSEAGRSSRQHRAVVDQVAAVQILQQALDMQQSLHREVGRVVVVPAAGPKAGQKEEPRA